MICAVSQVCNLIRLYFLFFFHPLLGPHNPFPCFMRVQTPKETFRMITYPYAMGPSESQDGCLKSHVKPGLKKKKKISNILMDPSNYHFMLSANIFLNWSVVIYDKDVGLMFAWQT